MSADLESVRHQLVLLTKNSGTRFQGLSKRLPERLPSDWRPEQVLDPRSKQYFTEKGAWEFVTELLENGQDLEEVALQNPPGTMGYVMKVDLDAEHPPLYVKLQLGSGAVIGRSFHYSKHA